jgi:hypothetical protein
MLTSDEAAAMLEVSTQTLFGMVKSGILRAEYPDGKCLNSQVLFHPDEVEAVMEIRGKRLDLAQVATMARQAYVASRQTERVVKRFMDLAGMNAPMLSYKDADVYALHVRVEDALLADVSEMSAYEIMEWAKIFYAVGEEYLMLIRVVAEDEEPWRKLLELSTKLCAEAPIGRIGVEADLKSAFAHLSLARRNMRNVAYFYVRSQHGKQIAGRAFPDAGNHWERNITAAHEF